MKSRISSCMLIFLIVAFSSICTLAAAAEFSADYKHISSHGVGDIASHGFVDTGKVFVKGDKERREMVQQGKTEVYIERYDNKLSWLLIPDKKQYREQSLTFNITNPVKYSNADVKYRYDLKVIGHATVSGYACKITQYAYKDERFGIVTVWFADKLNHYVKYEQAHKGKVSSAVEYSNIKVGNLDNSLFEIPKGYSKVSAASNQTKGPDVAGPSVTAHGQCCIAGNYHVKFQLRESPGCSNVYETFRMSIEQVDCGPNLRVTKTSDQTGMSFKIKGSVSPEKNNCCNVNLIERGSVDFIQARGSLCKTGDSWTVKGSYSHKKEGGKTCNGVWMTIPD